MNREEAIARIKDYIEIHRCLERDAVKLYEALDMAIKSLNYSETPNTSDTISRQAAIDAIDKALSRTFIEPCGEMILKDLPSAQRTGRWIVVDEQEPRRYGCSECKRLVWHIENYCPNCGADMRGEQDG